MTNKEIKSFIKKLEKRIDAYKGGKMINEQIVKGVTEGDWEDANKDMHILEGAIRATRITIEEFKEMLDEKVQFNLCYINHSYNNDYPQFI